MSRKQPIFRSLVIIRGSEIAFFSSVFRNTERMIYSL